MQFLMGVFSQGWQSEGSNGAVAETLLSHAGVLESGLPPRRSVLEAEMAGLGPEICNVLVPCVLQKFKEYVNGSNLITKLQAKHDLLKQTLGEGKLGNEVGKRDGLPLWVLCGPSSCFR